jgi:hypothetical protein
MIRLFRGVGHFHGLEEKWRRRVVMDEQLFGDESQQRRGYRNNLRAPCLLSQE